jgi:hypothetical protein
MWHDVTIWPPSIFQASRQFANLPREHVCRSRECLTVSDRAPGPRAKPIGLTPAPTAHAATGPSITRSKVANWPPYFF